MRDISLRLRLRPRLSLRRPRLHSPVREARQGRCRRRGNKAAAAARRTSAAAQWRTSAAATSPAPVHLPKKLYVGDNLVVPHGQGLERVRTFLRARVSDGLQSHLHLLGLHNGAGLLHRHLPVLHHSLGALDSRRASLHGGHLLSRKTVTSTGLETRAARPVHRARSCRQTW